MEKDSNKKGKDNFRIDTPIVIEGAAEPIVDDVVSAHEPEMTSDIISLLKGAVMEGQLLKDFKTKLALSGLMKDTDDLHVGRLGKTGMFHMAIINQKESSESLKVLIGGILTPMKKSDYDQYFMSGVYLGTDLIFYTDNDSLILVRDSIIIMSNGSIEKF